MIDARRVFQGAVADCIGDHVFDLLLIIAQCCHRGRDHAVDDLKVTAAGQFFELHECEVRLNPGGVAIHHQTDGAGRCNHGHLRVAIAVLFTFGQGTIPRFGSGNRQRLIRAIGGLKGNRIDRQTFIAVAFAMRGTAMVADHAQHVVCVRLVARKCPKLRRHLRRRRIGLTAHQRRDGSADRAALVAVIGDARRHQEAADVGITKTKRAVTVAQLGDFFGRELCHQHRDFERDGPKRGGVREAFDVKSSVTLAEVHQIQRR